MEKWDGNEERMNPYSGECKTHGPWQGPIDECPKCMEDDYFMSMCDVKIWATCARCLQDLPIEKGDDVSGPRQPGARVVVGQFFPGDGYEFEEDAAHMELCEACLEEIETEFQEAAWKATSFLAFFWGFQVRPWKKNDVLKYWREEEKKRQEVPEGGR